MSTVIDGSASVTINSGAVLGITSSTAVASTSGTYIDFTGIPSWVKRITVMFNGVSTNGTSVPEIRLGTSGGVDSSGYLGSSGIGATWSNWSTGIHIKQSTDALSTWHGSIVILLITGSTWSASGVITHSNNSAVFQTAGSKTLSGTLDRVRITTVNGTDTFDAGTINILYE